jgi:hypothetical protein
VNPEGREEKRVIGSATTYVNISAVASHKNAQMCIQLKCDSSHAANVVVTKEWSFTSKSTIHLQNMVLRDKFAFILFQ